MTPYSVYQLYQAERIKSDAERNQADAQLGMMAAAVSQLWRQVTTPVRALRRHRAENHLTARYAESDPAVCPGQGRLTYRRKLTAKQTGIPSDSSAAPVVWRECPTHPGSGGSGRLGSHGHAI